MEFFKVNLPPEYEVIYKNQRINSALVFPSLLFM